MFERDDIVRRSRKLLDTLANKIPRELDGADRQKFIGTKLLPACDGNLQMLLRSYVDLMLKNMREIGASDFDFGGVGSEEAVWFRIYGEKKRQAEYGTFTVDESDILIQNLLSEHQREALYEECSLDFSYRLQFNSTVTLRHRASAYFEMNTITINMRAINTTLFPFANYKFHPAVVQALSLEHTKEGLTLITGITGSGKSSTLDAIIDLNNRNFPGHIVLIAAPIEFVHRSDKCTVKHREVGSDTHSFKSGAIEALRQDPDIIVIGEMRDAETILTALEVADSGHKVFSTLHTSSAVDSIERIIGELPAKEQDRVKNRLADMLTCVISQKLVPSKDGRRVLVKEVMLTTPSVRAAIKNGNLGEIYQMISEGNSKGMLTLEQDLRRLVTEGKISIETAMNYSNNKRRMQQLLYGKILHTQ